ncbi:Immunoreactive 53 kDa antigen PG123 [Mucinivorans hirudinis]|uniref:Immunoreactive 53 kDa antigen PG123 n=1 Tax=Mucinivorans hirudinis TaxID=1433126 RepID=A0A060RD67_9BACT|nr:Immunoreactive 53 kDa antigen PG123 [Mucinivorans hirudinis]
MLQISRRILLLLLAFWGIVGICFAQQKESTNNFSIDFRYGSETLYAAYGDNKRVLAALKSDIINNRTLISEHKQHIRIVSVIPASEKGNIAAINFASIRGAVVRQWLRDQFSWLLESDFSFYISAVSDRNAVEVSLINSPIEDKHQSDIFFSLAKGYPEKVDYAVARYKRVPFLDGSQMFEQTGMDFSIIDPALDPTLTKKIEGAIDEQIVVTIYYRWDKDNLDKTYLTNTQTLSQIDSLLHLKSADYIDSLRIVAYASPEGPPDYNKRLSERRANTLKNYLLSTYPRLREDQIITVAKGENWDGFRRMALADPKLPMKEQVLSIIDNPNITDLQRQAQIAKMDGGRLYKNYILPNYYRYLRTGASLFVVYNPGKPVDIDFEPIEVTIIEPEPELIVIVEPEPEPEPEPELITKYPIALRTNLLYDALGAANLGIEVPIGEHFSVIGDFAYSYWRSSKNLYALQTLEYGIEGRYWFGVSERREGANANWAKPLKGWNVGVYGRYWQRYDAQWIDGVQGDGTWSVGLTAGYAFPIGKQLSFEAGIGAGWLSTTEYRHYHQPEYDKEGKYHLMWQQTGNWRGLSITKVRFSLVWLIEYQKRGGQK